jgi:adenine-specific DNA-methyltransferase
LETLVRYDYPDVICKGRYRTDRINTDFSRSAQVYKAMTRFVEAAAQTDAPLYLSYPANGLLFKAGGDPVEVLERHYTEVRVLAAAPLAHSTLGGAPGTAAINVTENVYYAR